jgi:hypothetical protein
MMMKEISMMTLVVLGLVGVGGTQQAHATNTSDYKTGYKDGVTRADNDWGRGPLVHCPSGGYYCPPSYPPGHTHEYYAGYKKGYMEETLHDSEPTPPA